MKERYWRAVAFTPSTTSGHFNLRQDLSSLVTCSWSLDNFVLEHQILLTWSWSILVVGKDPFGITGAKVRDGPIRGNHLWRRPRTEPVGVGFGDPLFADWQLSCGRCGWQALVLCHCRKMTEQMRLSSGNGDHSPGPRNDFTTFGRSLMECKIQDMDAYSQHYLGGT